MQEILVYIALALAIGFFIKKWFFKKKSKSKCGSDTDCNCG
ncbi:FeoB-associated Cys-rich membrane protein [Myroides ceti]|uniref:FeoB-associated Cys-rich membrane protein n=1 Tax=Paenimyroides ceti TaxID=395087 RepID=A0ABT8CMR1_9FLAO|nr:FeoB-associated Cys-rich membrane protein [Paenimyroides ceti]MDN3705575.1 FeoB-associated Cys-rich membrane protein [Paenimyroides ceti]